MQCPFSPQSANTVGGRPQSTNMSSSLCVWEQATTGTAKINYVPPSPPQCGRLPTFLQAFELPHDMVSSVQTEVNSGLEDPTKVRSPGTGVLCMMHWQSFLCSQLQARPLPLMKDWLNIVTLPLTTSPPECLSSVSGNILYMLM